VWKDIYTVTMTWSLDSRVPEPRLNLSSKQAYSRIVYRFD
jgi:hypothetical protein